MKSKIIPIKKEVPTIDWDKKQIVKIEYDDEIIYILTDGKHSSNIFSGTIIYSDVETYEVGEHHGGWNKNAFSKVDKVLIEFG